MSYLKENWTRARVVLPGMKTLEACSVVKGIHPLATLPKCYKLASLPVHLRRITSRASRSLQPLDVSGHCTLTITVTAKIAQKVVIHTTIK